ncbi:hypothetical protein AB0C02_31050 [Micromonospora sp. NPDC048999]|uniref:hypothetical protein n=1 Tax=Micromonospora sp. NPDC048999 TaxID=3155391 RepID=UPI0034031A71
MECWQAGADPGVKVATIYRAGSREQRAWYTARHVLEERDDLSETPGNPNCHAGYAAAGVCCCHLLTKEQFDGLTEPWTKVVGSL